MSEKRLHNVATIEERVRQAVKVADELIDRNTRPEHAYEVQWRSVFDAMMMMDWPIPFRTGMEVGIGQ